MSLPRPAAGGESCKQDFLEVYYGTKNGYKSYSRNHIGYTTMNSRDTIGSEYKNLILFLLAAFLIPFVAIVAQMLISNDIICLALYGIQAAAPTISAVIVLRLNKELKAHFTQMFRRGHLRMAVILPFIIASTTMILAKMIFCSLFKRAFILGNISMAQFVIILWALLAEEIGWRGYLEPLLKMRGVPKWMVPCIVGVVWCLWHYHFFLQDGMEVPMPLFFISCIIESYIYSFLMNVTNYNIVSAMTYHFAWNLLTHIVAINPADNNGNIFPYIILTILEALTLLVFWIIRKKNYKMAV